MNYNETNVAYVTSAWRRDWPIVLDPKHFEANLRSHKHEFAIRLVVLNNFNDPAEERRARKKALKLIQLGLATDCIHAPSYLSDKILQSYGLQPTDYWKQNPFFSTTHLAALHWLRDKADWFFFFNGDVWLKTPANRLPRAMKALSRNPQIRGLNLCRNVYRESNKSNKWSYAEHCDTEDEDLWLAKPPSTQQGDNHRSFGLSDLAFLIPVSPPEGWIFTTDNKRLQSYSAFWPKYAMPCFEMLYYEAMERREFGHGALKPQKGKAPLVVHKNFPDSKLKLAYYRLTGRYSRKFMSHIYAD